jgi:hypothetical protein
MSPNCSKIADITESNRVYNPIKGHGTALFTCKVTEPGWGFPQTGLYAIVDWDNSRHPNGFSDDDYAIAPIFLADE